MRSQSKYIKIIHLRRLAAKKQEHRCYYCQRLMTSEPQLQCTAEHLVARSNQGKDSKLNIAAACKFCNTMRHRLFPQLSASEYAARVKILIARNQWHEQHPAWKSLV